MSSTPGRMRALVPFFVPSPDGSLVVNETLSLHSPSPATSPAAPAPLIELPVRTWDHDAGVFRDSVHVVRDLPAASPAPSRSARPARLLTPADIRAARQAARDAAAHANKRTAVVANAQKSPSSAAPSRRRSRTSPDRPAPDHVKTPSSSPSKSDPSNRSPSSISTPSKQRAFAGSTFESASPPPGGLPIPAFVRRTSTSPDPVPNPRFKDVVEPAMRDPDARERAAVDLRRMLKI